MRDYLEVGAYFNRADRETPNRYPYIIELSRGSKRLTFIGTRHTRDITHQADSIDNAFRRLNPQIAFNEGGQLKRTYASRNEAIAKNGETGQLKYLCDSTGITMLDGDLDAGSEAKALFDKHGRKNVLLYLAYERFLDLYIHHYIDTTAGLEQSYRTEFVAYLQNNGVTLREEEKEFSYIRQAYQDFFREPLNLKTIQGEKFYFLSDGGELTRIGRSSKVVRDVHLLKQIEAAFQTHDRVFVVFGGAHAYAIEPALHQLMARQKVH
jgi:hypothetical protein